MSSPDGYLAVPDNDKGSPVLVLHAWWGLNDTIKAFCDRLAEAGFVAFAADLYHGEVTDQISEAEKLAPALDENVDQARADLAEAVKFLQEHPTTDASDIAVIGFSLGAYYALELSNNAPDDINAVVIFYGTGADDFSKSKAAYLGHFAADDPYEPQEYVAELEETIRQAGRPVTFHTYPDTGHWFFEPDRVDAYNAEAAKLAWERTIDFLRDSPTG
jgi:carboxymethylenebutenolidase